MEVKMEEKDIISLNEENKESFVLVERNKKREREKAILYFKRGLALILLIGICIGAFKLFPSIKALWNKLPFTSNENNESTDTSTISKPSTDSPLPPQSGSTNTSTDTDISNSYAINNIGKQEFKATNESGCDFDFSLKHSSKALEEIYSQYGKEAPVVLITHSQIRESYSNGISYSPSDAFYSDTSNVSYIGAEICKKLNSYGVNAIQISELYASGSIYGSQVEYEAALKNALKKYPSITYVFNISRGISINDDMTMDKTVLKDGELSYAQISIICGTSSNEANENQTNNVLFAFDFSKFANNKMNNIVKESKISRFELSQSLGPVSLNIDIGDYANSYEEAANSASAFASLFSDYLKEAR